MSMKRLAVIAAVSSHNGYHNQQNNTNFNIEKGVNHQGLQTMRSSGGGNSGNTTSLHGNVNIMLGGAMLSVVITVVCFVCYCCHRNIKKRTASAYRQQRWLENDPNMEIYSVEQCYDTSGLFIEQHHHHHHQSDQISIQPTSNLHGPPPSYEAVVALDEIIGRTINLNQNNNNNNCSNSNNNNNFYNNNNKENFVTNNDMNLDKNFLLEKLKQTTNGDCNDTNDVIIDENLFTQLRNENENNNNNGELIFNTKIIDNDDEYEYTNQIITNAALAAIANRKRNKRRQYCNCIDKELINNDKCNKCNHIINKNININDNDNDGACSSLNFVKTMDNNSPITSTPIIITPAPTPTLETNDIYQFINNNNNNNNELILENNNNNNLTSIIINNNNNNNENENDINDNFNNNNNMIDDNFNLNCNNNNNLEIFETTPSALALATVNNGEFLNNNNNNINPIDFTSFNENGLIRMDMSKIIDKTGLPTYEAALKLKSSGYV